MLRKITFCLIGVMPVAVLAFSTGPPVKRTGAAVDGGIDCTACHRTYAVNSDPRGSVTITAANYSPGVRQTIKVSIQHPEALRWGFEVTARLASDPSKQAGTFAANDKVRVRCDTTPGRDAPCSGALEFAEHSNAVVTAAGAGFVYEMEWTPPDGSAGDVIFYAAGNAANNDGSNAGDRIYTTIRTISPAACGITDTPAITSVVNGASFKEGISASSMVTIFGKNLSASGTRRGVGAGDIVNNSFPRALACVAVEIDGKRVPITYVQSDQINVQAPASIGSGPLSVRVIANPDSPNQLLSNQATAQATATAPAFFTFDGKNIAARFADTGAIVADPAAISGARMAKPGDIVTLFGTGFGPTDPLAQAGDIPSAIARVTAPVKVTIGGTTLADADVLYVGLSPSSISGLYQLNVRLPASLPDGNAIVSVQAGGATTPDGLFLPVKK